MLSGKFIGYCNERIFNNGNQVYEFDIYVYHFVVDEDKKKQILEKNEEGELKWMNLHDLRRPDVIPSDPYMINCFLFNSNVFLNKASSTIIESPCNIIEGRKLYKQKEFKRIKWRLGLISMG